MPRSGDAPTDFPALSPDLQVRFWTRLQLIRKEFLAEALVDAVLGSDIRTIDAELAEFVGPERLSALAAHALRGESFYPVPCILTVKPMLLGYYRLLYGLSQKEFYSKGPFGRFKSLEDRNALSGANMKCLSALCRSLAQTGWTLFEGIQPITLQGVHDLQLLTIGPQLRGTENNVIGQDATRVAFELVRALVAHHIVASTQHAITITNAAGRTVRIAFSADPDIAIVETLPSTVVPSVSIEIKGGADMSNVHNRIGEAEKSHQKARSAGFTQFWTVVKARVDPELAKKESPTTTFFFSLDDIVDEGTAAYRRFRDLLYQTLGIA